MTARAHRAAWLALAALWVWPLAANGAAAQDAAPSEPDAAAEAPIEEAAAEGEAAPSETPEDAQAEGTSAAEATPAEDAGPAADDEDEDGAAESEAADADAAADDDDADAAGTDADDPAAPASEGAEDARGGGEAEEQPAPVNQDDLPPALRTPVDDEIPGAAREPRVPNEPLRIVGSLGAGLGIRLTQRDGFQQDRLAPGYVEAYGGVVLPGHGQLRHEVGLAAGFNLNDDGTFSLGPEAGRQWTFTPAYTLRLALSEDPVPDWLLLGRVGVPLTVSPDFTWGLQLDVGATYMILAGLGVYAEVGAATFFGAEDRNGDLTVHGILSVELGARIEFEVLR